MVAIFSVRSSCIASAAILSGLAEAFTTAAGSTFLGSREQHLSGAGFAAGGMDLLQELERVVGQEHRVAAESRVERLEEAMRPLFQALPKDAEGRLDATGVRYLLRRLFVQRHGWFVNGLEPAGQSWNSSSPTSMLEMEGDIQGVFENHLNNHGFNLHQSAVLASTLENFVHVESIERLRNTYRVLGLSPEDDSLTEFEASNAMRTYMLMYVDNMDHANVTAEYVIKKNRTAAASIPSWQDTVNFVDEVRRSVLDSDEVAATSPTSWSTNLKVLEQVGERYGRWQDRDCRGQKRTLVGMGNPSTGRVPLDRFYAGALSDKAWMFLESVPYLRELGALDEANPESLSVIIPNYLNGHSNCLAGSKFYSVCCINECDVLFEKLEDHFGMPDANTDQIVSFISSLSSDTVQAPRTVPSSLTARLSEIASHHGGKVPLHGRLFSQWMHHAFPQECPYPHLSGVTTPSTPDEFMKTGLSVQVGKSEIRSIIKQAAERDRSAEKELTGGAMPELELPWSDEEELFVYRPDKAESHGSTFSIARSFLLMAAPFSALVVLLRLNPKAGMNLVAAISNEPVGKHFV